MGRNNPNIEHALIINALYGNNYKTTQELAIDLNIPIRTVQARCKKIRDSKIYAWKKNVKGLGQKIQPTNSSNDLFLTDDDIDKLYKSYFFNKIEKVLSKKLIFLLGMHLNSKKKLLIQKDGKDAFRDYFQEVKKVKKCIDEKKKINILGYKDRDYVKDESRKGKDYEGVTPIFFNERQNKICGKYNNQFRFFNLERISGIKTTETKAEELTDDLEDKIKKDVDVFGFLPKEFDTKGNTIKYKIVMKMTNFAYSLLIRQFPEIDNKKNIEESKKPEKMRYKLSVETFDPYALARFYCGIASEVKIDVMETDKKAMKKITEWFGKYVKEGLIENNFIKEKSNSTLKDKEPRNQIIF